jgi:hypothetical protein
VESFSVVVAATAAACFDFLLGSFSDALALGLADSCCLPVCLSEDVESAFVAARFEVETALAVDLVVDELPAAAVLFIVFILIELLSAVFLTGCLLASADCLLIAFVDVAGFKIAAIVDDAGAKVGESAFSGAAEAMPFLELDLRNVTWLNLERTGVSSGESGGAAVDSGLPSDEDTVFFEVADE